MITLTQEELEKLIHSCGFYHNKAKNILAASKMLVTQYNSKVPETMEELVLLPGVGRKTANVVGSIAFGIDAIAVDTHVFRVSNRIGITSAKDELHTELQLMEQIKKELVACASFDSLAWPAHMPFAQAPMRKLPCRGLL